MPRDESRMAAVLGELADLGRRISERAAELAGLVGDGSTAVPPALADRVADVTTSVADLAAATAAVTAPPVNRRQAVPGSRPRSDGSARASHARTHTRPSRPAPKRSRPATTGAAVPRPAAARDGNRRLRPLMPAVVSVAVNVAAMLVLALIFVAAEARPKRPVLTLGSHEEAFVDDLQPVELTADAPEAAAEEPTLDAAPAVDALAVTADAIETAAFDAAPAADLAAVSPVSFDAVDMLADIGGSGAENAAAGRGRGATGGGTAGNSGFFGRSGQGQTVCFVCDNSNSYRDGGFHVVLDEVARAVDALRPEQSFFVVFFSDAAYPMFHPDRAASLLPASPENKTRLRSWLATVEMCGGGQGIDEAVRIAGRLDADVIYFLSDGEHAASVVDRVAAADFGGAVVHTFGMQQGVLDRRTGQVDPEKVRRQQDYDRNLVAIATAHGGGFTPVMVPPQAAALERLRPIHRNRAPGPIWGSRL
ncbi:MAG: vWA domain-containing protein [Planctomycetaceae bacterium]